MRYLKSLSLTAAGILAWNIGSFLDHGNIQCIMAASKPLYMNTPPEMAMVFSCFAVILGLVFFFGEICEHAGVPFAGDMLAARITLMETR